MNYLGQFLSRFKIRTQILIAVMPILIAVAVSYFITDYNFRNFKTGLEQQKAAASSALLLSDLDTQIAEIQRSIFVYSQMGYSGVKRKVYYIAETLDTLLIDVEPYIRQQDEMVQEDFERLKEHYNRYHDGFETVAQQKEEITELSEQHIFPHLQYIIDGLAQYSAEAETQGNLQESLEVEKSINGLYRNSILLKSILFIPDKNNIEEIYENIDRVITYTKTQEDLKSVFAMSEHLRGELQKLFAKKRSNVYLLNVVLAGSAAEIDKLSDQLRFHAREKAIEINNAILTRLDKTRRLYKYMAFGALLFSILASWLISKGISKPVINITDTFDNLTSGEFIDQEIPGAERRDEVGRLAQSANEYRQMVSRLNEARDELRLTNQDLKVKNSTLEEFAKIAAHDLKEPIRNINLTADVIKQDYGEELNNDVKDHLEKISQQTWRLKNLVTDLLLYSRFGVGAGDVKKVNVSRIIDRVKQLIGERITQENVKIIVESGIPDLLVSEEKLSAVFRNLITNAIKYNDNHQKIIVIGSKPCDVKGKVIIFVKDNGIGIEERHQKRVFDIFKRLHHRDQYGGGTGMGLSIVDNAIKSMNESIWIESEVGAGTTFYFTVKRSNE